MKIWSLYAFNNQKYCLVKPIIVGACILDLAKKFMFEFYYKNMKKNSDCIFLFSDTEFFLYEVRSRDFFAKKQKKNQVAEQFDFLNFPPEHLLYSKVGQCRCHS